MVKSKKLLSALILQTGVMLTLCISAQAETAKEPGKIDPVVLTVNGAPVSRSDIDRIIALMVTQLPKHMETEALKQKSEEAARDKMVELTLLYEAGLKSPPDDIDKKLEVLFQEKRSKFTTVAGFENSLKKLGMTEAEYKTFLRKELVVNNYIKINFLDKVSVSDQEISDFYLEKKDGFKIREESRKVRHILVGADSKATPEQKAAAHEKAEKLRERVDKGEDFEEVARKESTDVTARLGGSLDFISRGQMPPTFEKAAYAMKRGEISSVVETPLGFHIIQLNDIKAAEYAPLEEVKEKIRDHLKSLEAKKRLTSYLTAAKQKAVITVADKK